jgi:isopentenyl diphosphate isomerase/L-lactate dehydrogenase-like FMN-dependent dehydrogenase
VKTQSTTAWFGTDRVENRGVTRIELAATSIGRAVQARIYREGAFGRLPTVPVSPVALERAARRRMSRAAFAYVAGSAGQERTARANTEAFGRWSVVPRLMRDTTARDTSVELFGRRLPAPVLLAPIGVLEMAHPGADVAVAEAASSLGLPMVFSTQASRSMEDCAAVMEGSPRWYQLYWSSSDELVASFLSRAERAGCEAVVVTLDTSVLGWRPRDLDGGYLPFAHGRGIAQYTSDPVFRRLVEQRVAHPDPTATRPRPTPGAVRTLLDLSRAYPGRFGDNLRSPYPRAAVETFLEVFSRSSLTWADLPSLRSMTSLPILVKGLLSADDADRALDAGADGIVVSNHGGRQVDSALAALDALPGVVDRVDGRVPVLMDSGIRSGADIVTALALGAAAVCVGRPYVYGLALAGADGVRAVLEHLLAELDLTMALTGVTSVAGLTRDLLVPSQR